MDKNKLIELVEEYGVERARMGYYINVDYVKTLEAKLKAAKKLREIAECLTLGTK